MPTIKVNPLSVKSVDKAIEKLEHYKKALQAFAVEYPKAVLNKLNEYIGSNAPLSADGMWEMMDVVIEEGHAHGCIVFDGRVEFIEFGTGIVGEMQHGGVNEEWFSKLPPPYNIGYNTGKKIVHISNNDDKPVGYYDYWWYYQDGKFVKTSGIPADPFIYRSVRQIIDEHEQIKNEILNRLI